jgi:tRNA G18 (ribose-2'-O)-methylase SpoU
VAAADLLGLIALLSPKDQGAWITRELRRRAVVILERLAHAAGLDPPALEERLWVPEDGQPPARLPVVLYLPHLRSPFNLGNMIRSAATFGIAGVVTDPAGPSLEHPRTRRAAMGGEQLMPCRSGGVSAARRLLSDRWTDAPGDAPMVVLETGGVSVSRFSFPPGGVLVAGHEERGVPEDLVMDARRHDRVLTIPHGGPKASLNVGVAVGIALSWWNSGSGA